MYFITRSWFCQHFFAIIFIIFDCDRFSRVCTAFFIDFFLHPSPRFLPAARTAGLRSGIFARFSLYLFLYPLNIGILRQTFCARKVCALFSGKKAVQSAKPAFFMIFLVSLLSFLCYNNLTICFNLCPCRGTGALRRASIRCRAAGFSLQRDTTEGRSYETGKRGNS